VCHGQLAARVVRMHGWTSHPWHPALALTEFDPQNSSAYAQQSVEVRIAILKDAIEAVSAAGDAIAKFTDGIAHLVATGASGYNYVTAQREYDRLVDLSARGTHLAGVTQQAVVDSIDDYLKKPHPGTLDWDIVTKAIQRVINDVKKFLDDVKAERSDFVREDAYATLDSSLGSRISILEKLSSLPQPVTPEEKNELAILNEKYKRLLANFKAAIEQLNLYLKQNKPA
jgi:hypothetical protein